ncbi:MAG: class I SAM-dependent methyltransferase [Blastochloris sp.]|nr:class I SAM-dependent methyltransferase [Blastochloris sp.]
MDNLQLLVDLHKDAARQGPGSEAETRLAISLSGLRGQRDLRIADIGCGTGASTLILAQELDAHITAVDFLPAFLKALERAAAGAGVKDRITTLAHSMDDLPFKDEELDAIWSEGAIYNMGFEAGIVAWKSFLKPGGILAVSELTWLTSDRPAELQAHWDREYSEVDIASAKMALLEKQGFSPMGYFVLPEYCWLDNYYRPMQERFREFLEVHRNSDAAKAIVASEEVEIALYERYRTFVSYGYYIARKSGE